MPDDNLYLYGVRVVEEGDEEAEACRSFYLGRPYREAPRENGCLGTLVAFVAMVLVLAPMLLSGGAL